MEGPNLSNPPNHQAGTIVLATGRSGSAVLQQALDQVPLACVLSGRCPIEVLTGPWALDPLMSRAASELVRTLSNRFPDDDVVRRPLPPRRNRAFGSWVDAPTAPGAMRFDAVRVPVWWRDSNRRCLVCRVSDRRASTADRPLPRLAALAHPRQRLAARLSRDREALSAELAAPWQPRLILHVGTWRTRRVAVVTHDVVTAELTWLALTEPGPSVVGVGPWEHLAVQQATVLGLGVTGPHELRFVSADNEGDFALAAYLRQRLGVGPAPERDEPATR